MRGLISLSDHQQLVSDYGDGRGVLLVTSPGNLTLYVPHEFVEPIRIMIEEMRPVGVHYEVIGVNYLVGWGVAQLPWVPPVTVKLNWWQRFKIKRIFSK